MDGLHSPPKLSSRTRPLDQPTDRIPAILRSREVIPTEEPMLEDQLQILQRQTDRTLKDPACVRYGEIRALHLLPFSTSLPQLLLHAIWKSGALRYQTMGWVKLACLENLILKSLRMIPELGQHFRHLLRCSDAHVGKDAAIQCLRVVKVDDVFCEVCAVSRQDVEMRDVRGRV